MRVLVTQEIDLAGIAILERAQLSVEVRSGESPIERASLLAAIEGCGGLMPMPSDPVDGEIMDAAPLQVVANHAVGVDNIDLPAARERGIVVTNTPGVLTEATADLTMALLLATARRIIEGDRLMRTSAYRGWRPTLLRGADLFDSVLGIVGPGRIGQAVARRAEAFGMKVIWSGREAGIPLMDLLAQSDFVSLHCPLNDRTRHLIGEREIKAMKPTAILVNTARGPVVDEAVLGRALQQRWIAAAGLDVFEAEPLAHPSLLELDNAVLLPHLGSATWRSRRRMAELAAENLVAVLVKGEAPPNRVA